MCAEFSKVEKSRTAVDEVMVVPRTDVCDGASSDGSIQVIQGALRMLSFNGRLFIKSGLQVVSLTARASQKPALSWGAGSHQDEVSPSVECMAVTDLRLCCRGERGREAVEDGHVGH